MIATFNHVLKYLMHTLIKKEAAISMKHDGSDDACLGYINKCVSCFQ